MEFSYTAGGIINYQQLKWLHFYVVKLKISIAYNSAIPLQSRALKKVQELLL